MNYKHAKTGWEITVPEITQGMLEEYFRRYRVLYKDEESATENYGAIVRAAIAAGWLTDIDVDATPPAKVKWIALKVNQIYAEVTAIPPE